MDDAQAMTMALDEATAALEHGDVPVGAVVVRGGEVIARRHNEREATNDPTAHAEILVLREAAQRMGNYRLTDVSVYVTVEPCLMCAGALVHARVREVVFGAAEPKTGALVSTVRVLDTPALNHRFAVVPGVREAECRELVQRFFQDRRRAERATAL